jgi:plastocyanin
MGRAVFFIFSAILLCAGPPALAATVTVDIADTNGHPVSGAVAGFEIQSGGAVPASHLPLNAVIDQRHETFIPLVTVIQKGGQIVFTNNDTTMHQVYSFSPIKQFEFEIDQGQKSQAVLFDKAGVASVGCNIHDQMITYVYVADTPWVARTDANGHATIDVPDGVYRVSVWHPQLPPGRTQPAASLTVSGASGKFSMAIPLTAAMPGMKHMHMGDY